MTPTPTPAQAVRVLEILEAWVKRGWTYDAELDTEFDEDGVMTVITGVTINYTNPKDPPDCWNNPDYGLWSTGVNHFDALCQATSVMQVLLAEHPENKP